jgi:hypothetical protein
MTSAWNPELSQRYHNAFRRGACQLHLSLRDVVVTDSYVNKVSDDLNDSYHSDEISLIARQCPPYGGL